MAFTLQSASKLICPCNILLNGAALYSAEFETTSTSTASLDDYCYFAGAFCTCIPLRHWNGLIEMNDGAMLFKVGLYVGPNAA